MRLLGLTVNLDVFGNVFGETVDASRKVCKINNVLGS